MEYDRRKELRYSSEQEAKWQEAAEKEGYTSVSEWIRETCDKQAAKTTAKK